MNSTVRKILKTKAVRKVLNALKNAQPWGFEGLSLYETGKLFIEEIKSTNLNERCAAVTYNFVMAIPPTMLFLFSLVPYLPLKDVQQTILGTIQFVTPDQNIRQSLQSFVQGFFDRGRGDILSFGILLTLFFSSNGMMGLMRSFDRIVPLVVKRTNVKRRWTAIKLTVMLLCVAIISLVVLIIQTNVVNHLLERIFSGVIAVKIVSLIVVLAIIFFSISIIYRYGPSLEQRFDFISPGSVFATLMIAIVTTVFFFLVDNFINYRNVYGPIGSLIAFMVWMWLNTMTILLGYELNVSILIGKNDFEEKELKKNEVRVSID